MIARWGESAETTAMRTETTSVVVHPEGEQPEIEAWSAVADTYGGRVHVEWDATAPVTPFGQLPFFIEYLKQGGLFDGWVADCPLSLSSPNAPRKRDLLGTVLLSVLAGHRRYAHITALRGDPVNPPLLGMRKVLSEDAVRRNLGKIDEAPGLTWLQSHLDLLCCTAAGRAVGAGRRHYDQAAVWGAGGCRTRLQSAQARSAVALLSHPTCCRTCGWC